VGGAVFRICLGFRYVEFRIFRLPLSSVVFRPPSAEAMIVCLERKIQSKMINYAKRSQFSKKSNVYNRNFNNELQQKMNNGHLVKTNPNKANFKEHLHLQRAGFAIAASA
jgi:hypothetical protein